MRKKLLLLSFLMICNASLFLTAQQVNTLYFMENVPVRHFLNPSFQPVTEYYVSLPVIGFTQMSVGNNSLAMKDILYNVNGQTVSFLNPQGNIPLFYNTLKSNTLIHASLQTNLLSVGFRHETAYWTFSLTEKADGKANLPKEVFQVALFGTPIPQNNSFDFTKLDGDVSVYTEAALGYSKQLNNKWTLGGKLKMLLGSANISNLNNQFVLKSGLTNWTFNGRGIANYAGPVQINVTNNYKSFSYSTPSNLSDWLKPNGVGAGIDAGFIYQLNKRIRFSGAINDLGFIRWTGNAKNYLYKVDYTLNGIKSFSINSFGNSYQDELNQLIQNNGLVDSIKTAFGSSINSTVTSNSYTTATTAKLNLGFEYSLVNDKISVGILSYSRLFKNILTEELTGSVNARPLKGFNISLSYSVINGGFNTIGAGLGVKTGPLYWFVAADYIPFQKSTLSITTDGTNFPKIKIPIPNNSTTFNLSTGMNIIFNKKIKSGRGLVHSKRNQDCNCEWN